MDIYHCVKKTLKETIVQLLTPKCYFLWHSLYMDNYYNSVGLSEQLLAFKIHTVGTLQSNRGEPIEVCAPHMLWSGDVLARDNGKVMFSPGKIKES